MDYHIIQVGGGVRLMGPQEDIHHPLERGWSPVKAEGKGPVLPVATRGGKSSFKFGIF